ncbi:methylated-DNA-protein-cysteine methyltransferase-like protein [Bacilli bacterium PM5-3]|nr:methylated-DNA-protein-cysteine methyltransferase-like protein [Bacilli bacterium PM5-3]MDH6603622.1 methylated-DNA-protein-cysteine methyltransferase-like protein [Bacilli bacterium PM5-9]
MVEKKLNEDFLFLIFSIVDEIPEGMVATYGQIARLAGYDKNSRLVGKALSMSQYYGSFPCHRVVNANGRCAIHWPEQRFLLENENITFKKNGNVDLKKHQWKE